MIKSQGACRRALGEGRELLPLDECLPTIYAKMKTLLRILLVAVALNVAICPIAHGNTLLIESEGSKISYGFNGSKLPLSRLLDSASDAFMGDPSEEVAIIFDDSIALGVALNARGIFNKVGYKHVRLFYRVKKTGKMCEISLGLPVPFTVSPE